MARAGVFVAILKLKEPRLCDCTTKQTAWVLWCSGSFAGGRAPGKSETPQMCILDAPGRVPDSGDCPRAIIQKCQTWKAERKRIDDIDAFSTLFRCLPPPAISLMRGYDRNYKYSDGERTLGTLRRVQQELHCGRNSTTLLRDVKQEESMQSVSIGGNNSPGGEPPFQEQLVVSCFADERGRSHRFAVLPRPTLPVPRPLVPGVAILQYYFHCGTVIYVE